MVNTDVNINVRVNSSPAQAELQNLERRVNSSTSNINNSFGRVGSGLQSLGNSFQGFFRQTNQMGSTAEATSNALNQMGSTAEATSNALNQMGSTAEATGESLGKLQNIKFEQAATSLIIFSGVLTLIGKQISEAEREFDKAMRNVNSITQLSEESYSKFSDSVRELSKDKSIVDGPRNLAEGLYQVVSSGIEASESLGVLKTASISASAGLTTTETSVRGLTALMNSYNQKTVKDSINFSDELFRVVDKGVISYEQLSNNLGGVVSVASSVNVKFKEVGAGFIELTRAGISAGESETAIANLLRSIADPSKEQLKYAKLLGVELGDVALQQKGLKGVMDDLGSAANGSLSIMMKLIPESRAAKAALTLAKDEGKGFARALGEMETSAGSTQRALEQQSKSLQFQMDKLKGSVTNLSIEFGKVLNEKIRDLLPMLKTFIDYLTNLDQNTKEVIVRMGSWTAAIGLGLIAVKGLTIAFGILMSLMSSPVVVAAGGFLALNEAMNSLKNSTNETIKSFRELLESFDLLGIKFNLLKGLDSINPFKAVEEGIKTVKAVTQAHADEKAQIEQKQKALENLHKLRDKEARSIKNPKEKLTADEQRSFANSLINLETFASNPESMKRLKTEAILRKEIAKNLEEQEKAKTKAEKLAADKKANDNKKRLEDIEKNAKKQEELEKENERKRKQLIQDREQAGKDILKIEKDLNLEVKKLTLDEFTYQKEVALEKLKDQLDNLDKIKALGINTTKARISAERQYQLELSKIKKDELNAHQKVEEEKLKFSLSNQEFFDKIKDKNNSNNEDKSEKEKKKDELKKDLSDFYKQYLDIKKDMSKVVDEFGKKVFKKSDFENLKKGFSEAYKEAEKSGNENINKIDFAKKDFDVVKKHKDILEEIKADSEKSDAEKLKMEKDHWDEILKITNTAMIQKDKMLKIDSEKIGEYQQEAKINLEKIKKEEKKIQEKHQKDIDDINKENAKSVTSSLFSALDEIFPNFSKIFDKIIDKNKDLQDELLKTIGIFLNKDGKFEGGGFVSKLFGKNENGPGVTLPEINLSSNQISPEKITVNKDKFSTDKMKELVNSSFGASTMSLISKEIKDIGNGFGNVQKTTKEVKQEIDSSASSTKDFGLEMSAVTAVVEGVTKAVGAMYGEIRKALVGGVKTSEDFQDSMATIAKSMPAGMGVIHDLLIEIPRQKAKAEREYTLKLKEVQNSITGNKTDAVSLDLEKINAENITEQEKFLKTAKVIKDWTKGVAQDSINNRKFESSLLKDKKAQIEANYKIELDEAELIDDIAEKKLKKNQATETYNKNLMDLSKEKRDLEIELEDDKRRQLELTHEKTMQNIKDETIASDTRSLKELLALKTYDREVTELNLKFRRLKVKSESFFDDDATKAVKNAQLDIEEIANSKESADNKEQQRIIRTQELVTELLNLKENSIKSIDSLMSKYYEKEAQNIKKNHKSEYDLIKLNEDKIKSNQQKIDKLNYELDKINKEFDKKLENKDLSKQASLLFSQERTKELSKQISTSDLLRTPVSEFERLISAKKEEINLQFETDGDLSKKSEELKKLALQQNIFYGELAKGIIKGTKEYDNYIKLANDGFRDYKSAVKDSIEVEKENRITQAQTTEGVKDLKKEIQNLSDENLDLSRSVSNANQSIQKDLDELTNKFKNSSGEWITDIDKAKSILNNYTDALRELNKIEITNKNIATNLQATMKDTSKGAEASNIIPIKSTINSSPSVSNKSSIVTPPPKTSTTNGIPGAKAGETQEQTIARFKLEDAQNYKNQVAQSQASQQAKVTQSQLSQTATSVNNTIKAVSQAPVNMLTSALTSVFSGVKSFFGFAGGGISDGPKSGYMSMLHGRELILNQGQGDNLAYILKMAQMNPNQYNTSNASTINFSPTINIDGSGLSKMEIKKVLGEVLDEKRIQKNFGYYSF